MLLFCLWSAAAVVVEQDQPCWFMMFVHVAKTGGTIRLEHLTLAPTRKAHIMQKKQLVELTTGPEPDPYAARDRRFAVEIHGHVMHDGCLQHHWTLPWAHGIAAKYRRAGCGAVVWTLLREPVAHFVSLFRWMNLGFRKKDFRQYMTRLRNPRLTRWAQGVVKRKLTKDEVEFLGSAESLIEEAHNESSRDWTTFDDMDKYRIFAIVLAQRGVFNFQSARLLPLYNAANTHSIDGLPQYRPKDACGNRTRWRAGDLPHLTSFDVIGLTELRAAALVRVAMAIGENVTKTLIYNDCGHHDNPARDVLKENQMPAPNNKKRDGVWNVWFKTSLPPILPKLLRILLDAEVQFYAHVRDQHWCQLPDVRATVATVVKACPHPWEYVTYNCASYSALGLK